MDFKFKEKSISLAKQTKDLSKVIMEYLDTGEDVNTEIDNGETILMVTAGIGDIKSVRLLLAAGANPNIPNNHGTTALSIAIHNSNVELSKILLQSGADPNSKDNLLGASPLFYAAINENAELVKLLLEHNANPNLCTTGGMNAVGIAAMKGNLHILNLLINKGADVNIKNYLGVTPLMLAARSGNLEIVKLIIEKGVDVNAVSLHGYNALICAIYSKKVEVVNELISNGADTSIKDNKGHSVLLFAVAFKAEEIVSVLIKNHTRVIKPDVNVEQINQDVSEKTRGKDVLLLWLAIKNGYSKVIDFLLKQGISPNSSYNGYTVLTSAIKSHQLKIARMLLKKGANPNNLDSRGKTALIHALEIGDVLALKLLLKFKAYSHVKLPNGKTLLMISAERANFKAFKILICEKLDINAKDLIGKTALIYAAEAGCSKIVKLLLDNDADPNITDQYGRTALINAFSNLHAITGESLKVFKLLLRKGANPNIISSLGETAITYFSKFCAGYLSSVSAIFAEYMIQEFSQRIDKKDQRFLKNLKTKYLVNRESIRLRILAMLLKHGINVNYRDNLGNTALIYAIENGNIEISNFLLSAGAEINIRGHRGETVLMKAINSNKPECVKLLLEAGAKVNEIDSAGGTALWMAIKPYEDNIATVKMLLQYGADPNILHYGESILFKSIEPDIISKHGLSYTKMLLEAGANPNILHDGKTPLIIAVSRGDKELAKLLLEYHARTDIVDYEGNTALSKALQLEKEDTNSHDLISLLRSPSISLDIKSNNLDLINAVKRQDIKILENLLNQGCNVNIRDSKGNTALFYATENLEILNLLLKYGADVNIVNNDYVDIIRIVLIKLASIGHYNTEPIDKDLNPANAKKHYFKVFKILLLNDVKQSLQVRYSTIELALQNKLLNVLKLLLTYNKDDQINGVGAGYALIRAIHVADFKTIKLIMGLNIDFNGYSSYSCDALYWAVDTGNLKLVKFLMNYGFNLKSEAALSMPVLSCAVKSKNKKLLKYLLDQGAQINTVDSYGNLALITAVEVGDKQSIDILLRYGADINTLFYYKSPLNEAALKGNLEMVKYLLGKGADPYVRETAIVEAIRGKTYYDTFKVINFLLDYDVNLNMCGLNGSPLMAAASIGDIQIVQLLLNKGVYIDLEDGLNRTALSYAVEHNKPEIVKKLNDLGASVSVHTGMSSIDNITPLEFAKKNGFIEIVKILSGKGDNIKNLRDGEGAMMQSLYSILDINDNRTFS